MIYLYKVKCVLASKDCLGHSPSKCSTLVHHVSQATSSFTAVEKEKRLMSWSGNGRQSSRRMEGSGTEL